MVATKLTFLIRCSIDAQIAVSQMTANALADNMMECYMHGMDSFVAKPVTFKKLEQVLKQFIPCLDRTQSSSSVPAPKDLGP